MQTNLRRITARSYKIIADSLGKSSSAWITDNFYVIDKQYRNIKSCKKAFSYTEMYGVLKKYCHQKDYSVRAKDVKDYLIAQNRHFLYGELSSVKILLAANAINKIAEMIKTDSFTFLPNTVKLLISLSDPEYESIVSRAWAAEKVIAKGEEQYTMFDDETKSQYRKAIADYAKKHSLTEADAAKEIITNTKRKNFTVGEFVYRPKTAYSILWGLIWALTFVFLGVISTFTLKAITVLLLVPFAMAATAVSDQIAALFIPPYRAPRLRIDKIPENAKTLVTVAALMQGNENDARVFEALEKFKYMNPDKNIYFCLLADLPDSKERYHIEDTRIINSARAKIDYLNSIHGDKFCLFFRERVLNKSENRFGGWERKRGAVCELISHIVNGDKTEFYGGNFIRDIKYILTLDTDTNLSIESVKELLSVALHPTNQPVVRNGRVVKGFGIIQPSVRTELASAYKSGFARLTSGTGGADIYASAGFHRSQTLFGSGNFCGKGLINVDCFYRLTENKIPEGLVLSHDCIEGSILRTMCCSDIILTDSTPGNTVSYFRRHHRWMRGDFQNLYFLKGRLLSPFYKWRLILTALRHTSPLFSVLAVCIGAFMADTRGFALFLLAYSEFFLPCVFVFIRFLFFGSPFAVIRFFSKAYSLITQTLIRLTFELSSSARRAELVLNAYIRAGVRLITRKKTLEWTTAAQTERLSSSLGKYVVDGAVSVALGAALLVFALPQWVRFCGLLYFVYPFVSVVMSRKLEGGTLAKSRLSKKQKDLLLRHAKDMFGFYADNVSEKTGYLPPDNIQFSPVNAVAMRTSPTNIGFYLVCLLAARDMNIISSKQLYEDLNNTVSTIEKLDKYKGNLYNWYDLNSLTVIGDSFVSTVDSGNFLVMISALKEGLKEYTAEEEGLSQIVKRCENIIEDTDILPLYDKSRNLFKIGIRPNGDNGDVGYYDLLMSECRMTAYFAVAKGIVPKKHWQALGRILTHRKGYLGMMSWSGTAFEYLMPQLFLPLYRDSFMYESVAFSVMVQKAENEIWGVSESGFYSFDSEMNYQYKANGIQDLALRRICADEKIISPYSTYLSLCVLGESAISNLNALEANGMYGKYGLYEAFDINRNSGGLCVKSYMAHHLGMSIISIMNAVMDNIFVNRFMADKQINCGNELLQEKIPIDAHIFENDRQVKIAKAPLHRTTADTESVSLSKPDCVLLSRGDLAVTVCSSGHIGMQSGERMLCNTLYKKNSLRFSPCVLFSKGEYVYGCSPLYGENGNYGFEKGGSYVSQIASGKEFSGRVRYSIAKNCNCLKINTKAEALKKYDVIFAFEPILDSERNYRSHISFSRLFLESEYDKNTRILYFHRRSRLDGSHIFTIAVAPRDRDMNFSFITDSSHRNGIVSSPLEYAYWEPNNLCGECTEPFCLVRSDNAEGGKCTFLVTCGETKNQCEKNIRLARTDKEETEITFNGDACKNLLSSLLYGSKPAIKEGFSNCSINDLWSKSISGDYPLAAIYLKQPAVNRTKALVKAFLQLARSAIRCELLFFADDSDNYNRPTENAIKRICIDVGAGGYINKRGGIFIVRRAEISDNLFNAIKDAAEYYEDFESHGNTNLTETVVKAMEEKPQNALPLPVPDGCFSAGNGYFTESGYVVDKSKAFFAPYSYILTGYRFSAVLTHNSLGYSFFDNARERRLCSFFGDRKTPDVGERILLREQDVYYDLCAISNKVIYEKGKAIYCGELNGNNYTVTVTVHPKFPVKLIRVQMQTSGVNIFELNPVMGDSVAKAKGLEIVEYETKNGGCMLFRNSFGMTFPEGIGFAGVCGGRADAESTSLHCGGSDNLFFCGACTTVTAAKAICDRVNKEFFNETLKKADEFADSFVPKMKFNSSCKETDLLMNYFLPYQVAASRFYARGSFYQSGGAYGFRDQLQDCLALIYSNPLAVRTHIIRCCAHQYEEGCVMHWWHTRHFEGVNRGVKSKCSDDLLYLPIVMADYLEKTGDYGLCDITVNYIASPPLGATAERYEQPFKSPIKESVFRHCLRALDYAYRTGKQGLILMGSCDWNDAFSLVGENGKGESVFSSLLYILAAKCFIPICRKTGNEAKAEELKGRISQLKNALENNAFYGDRYARAFCDDGSILGIEEAEECKIDIVSQAFAAMAGLDKSRVKTALSTAFNKLYDPKNKIFKLFSPPFINGSTRVGYIRGYACGIRENGGQYTHGALWGALGCIFAGMNNEALTILSCANPALKYSDRALGKKYKKEPYVISADIYSGKYGGTGGWSWYTGAAAWFYRIMLEYVYGLKLGAEQTIISAKPIKPFNAEITLNNCVLKIRADVNISKPTINGHPVEFPVKLTEGIWELELPVIE